MADRRQDIKDELAMLDLEERFLASKESGNRDDPVRAEFRDARLYWRQVRDAVSLGLTADTKKGKV